MLCLFKFLFNWAISNDIQKLLKYFNSTANVAFVRIPFAQSAIVFPNNLALYLKDVNTSVFVNLASKLCYIALRINPIIFKSCLSYRSQSKRKHDWNHKY